MKPANGWFSSSKPPTGATGIHVRVKRAPDGRMVITDLYVHGAELTAETLRTVNLSRLEAVANNPSMPDPGAEPDDELTIGELRQFSEEVARESRRPRRPGTRRPLQRPDGTDPDGFYREVADAYSYYASELRAPAKTIAAEADVPVATVHRWINEARRRGHLPPGRRGKVG